MKSFENYVRDLAKYNLNRPNVRLKEYFHCANGCGAKGGFPFPATIWFVNIESACINHDIKWEVATCYQDLVNANEEFDDDLKKICDTESWCDLTRWLRRMRISKYVTGVELVGTEAYAKERGFWNEGV